MIRRFAMLLAASTLFAPTAAQAEGREVATRVLEEWRNQGARVTLLPTRFLFDDVTMTVALPTDDDPANAKACTHVAVIGARGLSFRAKLSDAATDPSGPIEVGARSASLAGVLELQRCDAKRPVRHVVITSDAGRGAVEIIVARSDASLPALAQVIPERTGGALPPIPEAGSLPPLPSPEKRAEGAELRAKREGAKSGSRVMVRAGPDGSGSGSIALEAGCHRVEVFAHDPRTERPGRRFRLDLDAELRDAEDEHVIARDRTEAPDARLETCVGEAEAVDLVFAGSPPDTEVAAAVASWPMPAKLPTLWGPATRARMARAVFLRHVASPPDDAIFLAEGSGGTTPVPVHVEAGGCYLAIVALSRGHAKSLQLRATVGARESVDERGAAEETALAAFCARGGETTARVEIHARGPAIGWALAVFRVKSGAWELGR